MVETFREQLLDGYSRFNLPPGRPVKVSTGLFLHKLIDFDVASESVYCLFWQVNFWNDSRLIWSANTTPDGKKDSFVFFVG